MKQSLMKQNPNRREFIKKSACAAGVLGFPSIIPASVLGQNGKVAPSNRATIGVIGCGNRSASCISYVNAPQAEIVAVCDPFESRRNQRADAWGVSDRYNDFREILERDDIDGVHVVTADHWHVPISLAAARAGKDVYCEKPLGVSIEQDLAAREIVKKHNRIFQYGTQQRSSQICRLGVELVLNGHIGDVKEVIVWAPEGKTAPTPPEQPVPEGFDYNMWLGPAPRAPYSDLRVAKEGSWYIYDYALGFIAGWGAHPLDILQWWADEIDIGIPVEYKTTGTIPESGIFDTVQQWEMEAWYANGFKIHFLDRRSAREHGGKFPGGTGHLPSSTGGNGTLFIGSEGWVSVSRGVFKTSSEELRQKAKDPGPIRLPVSKNHFVNFADSILSRKQPVSTLDSGIRSDLISQIGDIGIRTGEVIKWDANRETIEASADAVKMIHRPMRDPWNLKIGQRRRFLGIF